MITAQMNICVVSEWQDALRYNMGCVEKILISIKFILITLALVARFADDSG